MTVSSTSSRVVYAGNGSTTVFPFAFKVALAADLVVVFTDTSGSDVTLSPSQYDATGFGLDAGGSVTYPLSGGPIATGTGLTIYRNVAVTQPTSISNQGAMWPQVIEAALDRLTYMAQKVADTASRSLTVGPTESAALDLLPNATQRANALLGFDADGQPYAATGLGTAAVSTWLAANFLLSSRNAQAAQALGVAYAVGLLADLKALTDRPALVTLSGRGAANDGGGGLFVWTAGDSTTADDALVVQCTAGAAGRYKRLFDGGVQLAWFGAFGGGQVDESTQIQAALNSGFSPVFGVPDATYRVSFTVVVPYGVTLDGGSMIPGNPAGGTRIVGDAAVSPVLRVGAGGSNGTAQVRQITVTRAGTSPSTSTIGIEILDGQYLTFENVRSDNHGVPWKAISHPASGLGLGLLCTDCYSSRATDAHAVNDSWAEWTWLGGRFGLNGTGDYDCNAFVRLQGGVASTAGGPNTVTFTSVVFAQGGGTGPAYFWQLVNLGAGGTPNIDAVGFNITDCHIETVRTAIFKSDSTWDSFSRFTMMGSKVNCPTVPMWALDVATQPDIWNLVGNTLYVSTFNLAPTLAINSVSISGGFVSGTMSLTGVLGSTMAISGLGHGGNFTLAGTWGTFSSVGEYFTTGSFTNSASGAISVLSGLNGFRIGQANSVANNVLLDSFAASNNLNVRRSNGTAASPTALQTGQVIGSFSAFGYGATGYSASTRGGVALTAAENWTDTAQGTRGFLQATIAGSTTLVGAATWDGGTFTIGSGIQLRLGNAYVNSASVSTGYLILYDSTGTAYEIPAKAH
jgi:hypothetical protein